MTAATNLNELAKEETEAITAETEQRELKELQAIFGSERKDLASRSYRAALGLAGEAAEAEGQATRARRDRPRADGPRLGLPRRHRARASARPGMLVNEELRGDVAGPSRAPPRPRSCCG